MKVAVGIVIVILLLVGGIFYASQYTSDESGGSLPTVELQNSDGDTVTIQDFQNGESTLVINSWATWCPFCVNELPDFVSLQEEFPNITVIAVNRRESVQQTKEYLEGIGIENDLVYLYDANDSWYRSLGGFTMPETIFVNSKGEIVVHKRGFMALPEMREHVEAALTTKI